jgi:hypothetical protein
VLKARASARAFVVVRFGQISFTDEAAERRGEMLADLLPPLRRLELMDVQIHGDRGASVAHLALHANRVEAALGEM